jgi:hypothetical protein
MPDTVIKNVNPIAKGTKILTALQSGTVSGTRIGIVLGTGPKGAGLAVVNESMPKICIVNATAAGITAIMANLPIPLHPPIQTTNTLLIGIKIIPVSGVISKTIPVDIVTIIVGVTRNISPCLTPRYLIPRLL